MLNLVMYEPETKKELQKIYDTAKFNAIASHISNAMDYPPCVPLQDMEKREFKFTTNEGISLSCIASRQNNCIKIFATMCK